MPSTTKGLPYPSNSDDVDVPGDIQALAEAVDTELNDYLTTASASSTYQQIATVPSPNRNLLYNGAMQVSQRGTSTASITANTYGAADRWRTGPQSMGTWTQSVETDAPTGSGFRKSTKILCTTADASPAAGDYIIFAQDLEGQDLQRIAKGTSSAQQLTLSFWVKSNVTGTYIANLYDNDNTRWVSASYTISASATWERKTITFPADTTGAFDNDNAASLTLVMFLGAGSTYTSGTLGTTWRAAAFANADIAVGQTNLAAATNNYWQITGVQLEVGSQATAFEFKSYGQELRECQRYYWRRLATAAYELVATGVCASTTRTDGFVPLPVTMRVTPTAVEYSTIQIAVPAGGAYNATALSLNGPGPNHGAIQITVASGGGNAGTSNGIYLSSANTSYIAFLAEL